MGIWDKAAAPDQAGFVRSLLAHAAVLSVQGQAAAALDAYDRALRIQLPVLGPSHPDIAAIEVKRAALLAQTDRKQESLTVALGAEATGRQHLSLTLGSLPERQALDYAAKRPQGLGLALSLVTADSSASVLDAVVRGRSLVLDEMAIRRHAVNDEAGGPAASLWTALRQARQRLANLVIRGPGSLRPEQYTALISQAQQEKEDAERALGERSAAFRSEMSRSAIGLDEIRKRLPADSALVSLVRYDRQVFAPASQTASPRRTRVVPSYLGFVLRSDGSDPIVVPLGPAAAIDAAVARWRRAMKAEMAVDSSGPPPEPSLNSTGVGLRRQIWDPIAAQVGDAARVFVVPDGAFNLVPLAALPSARGRYLVEDGPIIHYLSAERDLVLDETTPKPSSAGLLSVGGASFSDGSVVRVAPQREVVTRRHRPREPGTSCSLAPRRVYQLRRLPVDDLRADPRFAERSPGRRRPVASVRMPDRALNPRRCRRWSGRLPPNGHSNRQPPAAAYSISPRTVSSSATTVPRSSRALARSVAWPVPVAPASKSAGAGRATGPRAIPENPLLLSGLALAGANRRSAAGADEDDGILSAEEVAGLNLQGVEWAVLSACDTGLGTVISREGVLGLRRAFQVAGVRTVIMSLWSVDDRATLEWMQRLYEARFRGNLSTVDAMRDASVRVIRDRRSKGLSTNPFYWAAFVASGDWR